jgi:prevent-host-death family protein
MHVPIRELKAKLSEFLRLAAEGEEVIVTLHKRPVAKIVPMGKTPESEREAVDRLNAMAWVRCGGGGVPQGSRTLARVVAGGTPVSRLLIEPDRTKR